MFMTNIVSISAPFLQYKRSPSTKGTIFLHQDEKFRLCQPYLLHYHRDRLHPPQQGLPHAHHHLHHCGDGYWLSPFSESLPILFLRRWNYLDVFCSKQRKNALSSQCHCHSKSLTLDCAMQTVHQWHFPHRRNAQVNQTAVHLCV